MSATALARVRYARKAAEAINRKQRERRARFAAQVESGEVKFKPDEVRKDLWHPQSGPQTDAMASPADVIGFGGAAGGGKSDLALGLGLTQHFRSVIFRRQQVQHTELVRRAKEITEGIREGFNGSSPPTMTLPGGATIEFGSMNEPGDWVKWKGRPHDLLAIDEATEFLELQVRAAIAWVRTAVAGQRCRILLTFNPPTDPDGEWVIDFFGPWINPDHPNPAEPGELRWFAQMPDEHGKMEEREVDGPGEITLKNGETVRPQSRTFFPARIEDNVYYARDGEYVRRLQNTPEPLRSQLLYGVFARTNNDDPWRVLPRSWVMAAVARGRDRACGSVIAYGMDVAAGGDDKTVFAPRDAGGIGPLVKYAGKDTPDGKTAAEKLLKIFQPGAYANIDAFGCGAAAAGWMMVGAAKYGASTAERFLDSEATDSVPAYPVNVGDTSHKLPLPARPDQIQKPNFRYTDKSGRFKMRNLRAEMYWRLREAIDPEGGHEFALPNDAELIADLCAPRYEITASGIQIEDKDDIKARLPQKRSPDCGDAAALSMLPSPPPNRQIKVL